jgi:hypothetical protein
LNESLLLWRENLSSWGELSSWGSIRLVLSRNNSLSWSWEYWEGSWLPPSDRKKLFTDADDLYAENKSLTFGLTNSVSSPLSMSPEPGYSFHC